MLTVVVPTRAISNKFELVDHLPIYPLEFRYEEYPFIIALQMHRSTQILIET